MEYADFCNLIQKSAVVTLATSGVTGPILIIFAHDIATILPLNTFELELPYSYVLRNASLPNKVILPIFPKLVAMSTSIGELEEEVHIDHLQTNTYHMVQRSHKSVQWILR